ncbi:MAG: hypothetical protein ABIF17_04600 [Patescibacteria group bacterium]
MTVREKLIQEAEKRGFEQSKGYRKVYLTRRKTLLFETEGAKDETAVAMRINYDLPYGDAEPGCIILTAQDIAWWLDSVDEEEKKEKGW